MVHSKKLSLNDEALILYFMAKSGKANIDYIKTICDSLLAKLEVEEGAERNVKLTYHHKAFSLSAEEEDDTFNFDPFV